MLFVRVFFKRFAKFSVLQFFRSTDVPSCNKFAAPSALCARLSFVLFATSYASWERFRKRSALFHVMKNAHGRILSHSLAVNRAKRKQSVRRMRSQFRHETENGVLGAPQQAANFNFVMKVAQLASIFCGFRHRLKFETAAFAFCHTS